MNCKDLSNPCVSFVNFCVGPGGQMLFGWKGAPYGNIIVVCNIASISVEVHFKSEWTVKLG